MDYSFAEQLSNLDIDNVFLYVADAVRQDKLPLNVHSRGINITGIASSTHSPPSFASIVSGLHPPSHGVYWFSHTLDDFSIFDVEQINTYYESSMPVTTGTDDSFFRIFDIDPEQYHGTVSSFEPPFFAMERGHGGHAPYDNDSSSAPEYFKKNFKSTTEKIERDYERCVERDGDHFLSRIAALDERDLLEETLVIYTSDHGELLGEGGMLGHNAPMRPELVRVPTVFIHPDIDSDTHVNGIIRHIDFLPTILELLGVESKNQQRLSGKSLVSSQPASMGLSFYDKEFFSTPLPGITGHLDYSGAWDQTGGHVFTSSSRIDRLSILAGKLATGTKRRYLARNVVEATQSYLRGDHAYGDPQMTRIESQSSIQEINDSAEQNKRELSEKAIENLQDLGYR